MYTNLAKFVYQTTFTQRETGVFVTGSASFDLRSQIGEPLTGRSRFFHLYPLSISEVSAGFAEAAQKLPLLLVYGSYPQVYQEENLIQKRAVLEGIKNGYLLRDVLQLANIKDSQFVMNLLRLLAFQIGNDISYQEMARNLGSTVKTIPMTSRKSTLLKKRQHSFMPTNSNGAPGKFPRLRHLQKTIPQPAFRPLTA